MCWITLEYVSFRFVHIFSASLLLRRSHSGQSPPDVVKMSGTNDAFSTCMMRSLYILFFSISWWWYICSIVFPWLYFAFGCVILTSKNVRSFRPKTPLAEMSNRALSAIFAPFRSSASVGNKTGSVWTSLQTSFIIVVSVSRRELWRIET